MPDMSLMCKSLKILWVKRLLNEEDLQWKIISVHYLEKVGGKLIFLCNYEMKKIDLDLPLVYKDMLTTWSESKQMSPQTSKDIYNEILWSKRFWKIILKSETDTPISRAATLKENIDYTLNIGGRTLKTDKLTNKLIYNSLRNKVSKKPTAEKKLKQFIGDNDLTLVYGMPFKITKSTKLQYFQFKMNHGHFPTNRYLNNVNKLDTKFC